MSHAEFVINPAVQLERRLQLNVGLLVILATSLLAMGQQNLLYALVAAVAVVAGIYVADVKQSFQLNADTTTLAAVVACAILVVQVIRNAGESQLLNVANILIYLEIILLFQRKEYRTYWSLIALSLLQVIVAAALNLGLVFGLLMAFYIVSAFSALTMLFIVSETKPFLESKRDDAGQRTGASSSRPSDAADPSDSGDSGDRRPTFLGRLPETAVLDIANREFLMRLAKMMLFTAVATFVAFLLIPRYSQSAWEGAKNEQTSTSGFTEEVNLDDIGRILESPEQVMRVEFTDIRNRPYKVDGEPYFRGTVLDQYTPNGSWQQNIGTKTDARLLSTRRATDLASVTLQHTSLQPGVHSVLFNASPCHEVDETPKGLYVNPGTFQITFADGLEKARSAYQYTLGSSAFRNGWQRDLIPVGQDYVRETSRIAGQIEKLKRSNPGITETAARVIEQQDLAEATVFEQAKALENHFRRSGEYKYSLVLNQNRIRGLDPIEDFVNNHKTGHCEYFAGALTLMLRSQGIPARMVIGYKGGDFNAVGEYYTVRQLHAHAWVEAFLEPDQIPEDEVDAYVRRTMIRGAWLRLDPTPDSDDVSQAKDELAIVTTIRELLDYCQVLWDDYVLGLNASRQYNTIYRPLILGFQTLFSGDAWKQRFAMLQNLGERKLLGVSWLALLAGSLLAACGCLYRYRRAIRRACAPLVKRLRRTRLDNGSKSPSLAVYRQLETVLAKTFELKRSPSQTIYEFANEASQRLSERDTTAAWADLPLHVADTYYQVRFGGRPLPSDDLAAMAARVRSLTTAAGLAN